MTMNTKKTMATDATCVVSAGECRVRDFYAEHIAKIRPKDRLVRREQRYDGSRLRADMRTVNEANILNEWEFKLYADYKALGQILQYVALARETENFRPIRGVIAAFEFSPELVRANEILNLNLDLVIIPDWMRAAGGVVQRETSTKLIETTPRIPMITLA